ncbi:hypothetical protein AWB82_03287 [Caballeronia glebae]|uniref:Putative hydro-lyase AWB82_03287 n=1 Tax=Caballeronia glebae TaxID=1777143 RepID=A0A158AZN9_9BURK|nr:putative hydro-lyase [Caballeronia glebae]SAK63265.1 hypothetical protein AWB82_03287 [Caballeronia glebae]
MTPYEFRQSVRRGEFTGNTAGICDGYIQANVAILPKEVADDFAGFCGANPQACPILAVSEAGSPYLPTLGKDIDVRTDVPGFFIYRDGKFAGEERTLLQLWRDDFVTFAIGCSYSFEHILKTAGLRIRHLELGYGVPAYNTNIPNKQVGPFGGNLVVSMRPFNAADTIRAIEITSGYPNVHGAPVHFGDPAAIGIRDVDEIDYGGRSEVRDGEYPVFWACGVTPQVAMISANLPLGIGHAPGHMLVTDLPLSTLTSN